MKTRQKVLELKAQGKANWEIVQILNLSKSVVSYHTCASTKENNRTYNTLKKQALKEGLVFKRPRKLSKYPLHFRTKVSRFAGHHSERKKKYSLILQKYKPEDVVNKFGINTKCYLTGKELNLLDCDTSFDHIVPLSKGGTNNLDNLGITTRSLNFMKTDLLLNELIQNCIDILSHNGYLVTKKEEILIET